MHKGWKCRRINESKEDRAEKEARLVATYKTSRPTPTYIVDREGKEFKVIFGQKVKWAIEHNCRLDTRWLLQNGKRKSIHGYRLKVNDAVA